MIRTQIQMTEDQITALKKLASLQNQSMAGIIRQIVDNFIASKASINLKERQRRAIAVSGRFHSKVSNLSKAHDEYLAEAFYR